MVKLRKVRRPNPFGHPHYPAFDFYISHGTIQVCPIRGNAVLYEHKFGEFKRWLDKVQKYADYEMARNLK